MHKYTNKTNKNKRMDYKMINTLTKKDYKELTLEEFEAMIHNDEPEAVRDRCRAAGVEKPKKA